MIAIGILGTGSYVPENIISNEAIAPAAGVTAEWISRKTGILARRRAAGHEATSDLAVIAAERALQAAGVEARSIRFIVVATSTPDHPQPAVASIVQSRLGACNAGVFDVNAVCSGFVYALSVTQALLGANAPGSYGLVIGADIYSRILDYSDRRTAVLFGDGAGAVVLGPAPRGTGLQGTHLRGHGHGHELIRVPAGGSRLPASAETLSTGDHYFKMDGRGVRQFVTDHLPEAVSGLLSQSHCAPGQVKHFVPHQANGQMLREIGPSLGLNNARTHLTVGQYGNTGAASIPITLDVAQRGGDLQRGDLVVMAAFGGGMNIGASLSAWSMPAGRELDAVGASTPAGLDRDWGQAYELGGAGGGT